LKCGKGGKNGGAGSARRLATITHQGAMPPEEKKTRGNHKKALKAVEKSLKVRGGSTYWAPGGETAEIQEGRGKREKGRSKLKIMLGEGLDKR